MNPRSTIIVPLDVETLETAEDLVRTLKGVVGRFKIGNQLFTRFGPAAVEMVHKHEQELFLDLKYHDIPNTVAEAVVSASRLGVWMLNMHVSGGSAMMKAAVARVTEHCEATRFRRPILLGVTVLTSLDEQELQSTLGTNRSVPDQVLHLARQAQNAGLDGVVASPHETTQIRQACGPGFVIVTPGVRPAGAAVQDQKRVMTPTQAVAAGANYLVIGRPIYAAPDPRAAAERIVQELSEGSSDA